MAKVITGFQWGEKMVEVLLGDFPMGTKMQAFGENERIGVIQAFTTRIGEGAFPTEQNSTIGVKLRELEEHDQKVYKRYGWIDIVMLKDRIVQNNITSLILDDVDIMGQIGYLTPIQMCVSYMHRHQIVRHVVKDDLLHCVPMYGTHEIAFGGWDLSECKRWENIPARTKGYIQNIERRLGVPIKYIRIGPKKSCLIYVPHTQNLKMIF